MCQIDDMNDLVVGASVKLDSSLLADNFNKVKYHLYALEKVMLTGIGNSYNQWVYLFLLT